MKAEQRAIEWENACAHWEEEAIASQARETKLREALVALDEYYSTPGEDDWVRFLNEVLTPAREVLRQTAEELK
jgi:hypothetical protein